MKLITISELAKNNKIEGRVLRYLALELFPGSKINGSYIFSISQADELIKKAKSKINMKKKIKKIVINNNIKDCSGCIPESCKIVNEQYCTVYPKTYFIDKEISMEQLKENII